MTLRTLAALAPIAIIPAAIMQIHYVLAHVGTISLIAAAVTGGAAILVHKAKGKGKQLEQEDAEDVVSSWQPPSLPKVTTAYVSPTVVQQRLLDLAKAK